MPLTVFDYVIIFQCFFRIITFSTDKRKYSRDLTIIQHFFTANIICNFRNVLKTTNTHAYQAANALEVEGNQEKGEINNQNIFNGIGCFLYSLLFFELL